MNAYDSYVLMAAMAEVLKKRSGGEAQVPSADQVRKLLCAVLARLFSPKDRHG